MLWEPATSVNFLGYCRCSAALRIECTETEQMWEAHSGSMELIRTVSPKINSGELTPPKKKKYFFQVNTSRKMSLVWKIPYFSFVEWLCSQALTFCRLKESKICSYSHLNLSLIPMTITVTIQLIQKYFLLFSSSAHQSCILPFSF